MNSPLLRVVLTVVMLGALSGGVLLGCGGGGGGGPTSGTAPQISDLVLLRSVIDYMAGGGRTTVGATLDYFDPEADIVAVRVEVSDGSSLSIPVPALPGPAGTLFGSVEFSTDECGVFFTDVWVVDRGGRESNVLETEVTVAVNLGHWQQHETFAMRDVAWNGSRYVAFGFLGRIMTSEDAANWVTRDSDTTDSLTSVIWDGFQFIGTSHEGAILSSPDGLDWVRTNRIIDEQDGLATIAYSGSIYVAGGRRGPSRTLLFWSLDGLTWNEVDSLEPLFGKVTDIAWNGTRFVATLHDQIDGSASVLTSTNGVDWETVVADMGSAFQIIWTGDRFLATGVAGRVYISPDGLDWSTIDGGTAGALWGIAYNGVNLVAGGFLGIVGTIDNGETWVSEGRPENLRAILWADGQFVGVGDVGIYTSP